MITKDCVFLFSEKDYDDNTKEIRNVEFDYKLD